MKYLKPTALLLAAAMLLSSCSASEPQETQNTTIPAQKSESASETSETTPPAEETQPEELDYDSLSEDEYRRLLIERSLISAGDTEAGTL